MYNVSWNKPPLVQREHYLILRHLTVDIAPIFGFFQTEVAEENREEPV
jgi:hypothetical protein